MPLTIPIISGTTRPGNKTQHAAAFVQKQAEQIEEIQTQIISPDMFNLPYDGNDDEVKDLKYTKITEEADGFIIVLPEYNHSFPGTLKRMLDSELANYIHKPVALVGVSSGIFGGSRAIENILSPLREMGMTLTFSDVYVTDSYNRFDNDGNMIKDVELYEKTVATMLEELTWMARTMQYGRDNLPSKYHEK